MTDDRSRNRGLRAFALHVRAQGALAEVRPDEIAGQVVRGLVEETGVDPGIWRT